MKISDYIMEFIASLGVDKVFCVTGGGAMHMNHSLGQSKKLTGVYMIHEQGASIAAESYARIRCIRNGSQFNFSIQPIHFQNFQLI